MTKTITTDNLIESATIQLNSATHSAYRIYTDRAIKLAPLMFEDFDVYDSKMKTAKSKLSQSLGAANKSSKGIIIQFYAEQFSELNDPYMSARVADDIFKITVGRSMSKSLWKGLFHREANNISPYFLKNSDYKKTILSSPIVTSLRTHMSEFDLVLDNWRNKRENPYQQELDNEIKKTKQMQSKPQKN